MVRTLWPQSCTSGADAGSGTTLCRGCCPVRMAGSLRDLGCTALLSRPECGCYRCSRHLYRWSTNGISAIWVSWSYESPSPLCDVLCEVPLGCRVRRTVLSRVSCCPAGLAVLSHRLVSWGVPSGGERDPSHLRKASLCPHTVVAYHCG